MRLLDSIRPLVSPEAVEAGHRRYLTLGSIGLTQDGPHHLMTSSARDRSDCAIVRPIALAVLRLMKSSNLPCSTGRSLGFAPLRILSTIIGMGPPKIVV